TVAKTPLTALNPLEMMLIKPVMKPSWAFAGWGTTIAMMMRRATIRIRWLAANFQIRPIRPHIKARFAGISSGFLPTQLRCFRARLPRERGVSLDGHGVVPEARCLLPKGTRNHLLDMGVALQRGNVCCGSAVSSSAWRNHESVARNGVRRRDRLIGPRVSHFEHHQVVDRHCVINVR